MACQRHILSETLHVNLVSFYNFRSRYCHPMDLRGLAQALTANEYTWDKVRQDVAT